MSLAAVDTSTLIAFFHDDKGRDVERFLHHLEDATVRVPPPVLLEALSDHATRNQVMLTIGSLKMLDIMDGFWLRASALRANILKHKLKARTADVMIAQCCIDHKIPLITRDSDFKHCVKYGGLKLL